MSALLTKSDFKVARTCATKLYFRKLRYPTTLDEDEYAELLARGGYMIEKMAQLLYPEGRSIPDTPAPEEAARLTMEALRAQRVTLFQPTLLAPPLMARIDILVRQGDDFEIVEVKGKSYNAVDSRANIDEKGWMGPFVNSKGEVASDWREHIDDVAFQAHVLRLVFPNARVKASLLMPDTSKTTGIDQLHRQFELRVEPWPEGRGRRLFVSFLGDAAAVRRDHFLEKVDATDAVNLLRDEVATAVDEYAKLVSPELVRRQEPLAMRCKKCEFRTEPAPGAGEDAAPAGFMSCWGELGAVQPHLFDLYHIGSVKRDGELLGDTLIAQKKVSLYDVDEEMLTGSKAAKRQAKKESSPGTRAARQLLQIRHTRDNTEFVDPVLFSRMRLARYPLHFIDFETSSLAVPYHAGMYPYETVAFQWSCHTIEAPGAPLEHRDWINVDDAFPNFAFASTLRACCGDDGTLLTWHRHEQNTLRAIAVQLERRVEKDPPLAGWLHAVTETEEEPQILDMEALTLAHYFHPIMKGRTSIKKVLAAVWSTDEDVRAQFPEYVQYRGDQLLSPYDALDPILIDDEEAEVREGTGAMLAYQKMLYGVERRDPLFREKYKELLLQYCKLDTAAMVMIWRHWERAEKH